MNRLLRERREAAVLTQEELSARIGASTMTVRRWEAGSATPQPAYLRKLCETLRASPAEIGFPPAGAHAVAQHLGTRWGTAVGRLWFPWVVASYGPYRPE